MFVRCRKQGPINSSPEHLPLMHQAHKFRHYSKERATKCSSSVFSVPTLWHSVLSSLYEPMTGQTEIPVIDLAGLTAGGEERSRTMARLHEACRDWGFFWVTTDPALIPVAWRNYIF